MALEGTKANIIEICFALVTGVVFLSKADAGAFEARRSDSILTDSLPFSAFLMAPLFQWLQHRSAGVLLHPTSLPGSTGIGTIGREARHFVDFLAEAGMKTWQVCPLGPTGFGDSPYQCFSAFAGNPYFIDLETLIGQGLLKEHDLD